MWRRSRPFIFATISLCALLGATFAPTAEAGPVWTPPPKLPKWQTWDEKNLPPSELAKDANFKANNPTVYGITEPPVTPVTLYAEWEPITHVYYTWFVGQDDDFFWGITNAILQHGGGAEPTIMVDGSSHLNQVATEINNRGGAGTSSNVTFINMQDPPFDSVMYQGYSLDSVWTVDYGPFWVTDGAGTLGIVDTRYYPQRDNDDAVPSKLGHWLGVNVWRPDFNLEGGNFSSDGNGTCVLSKAHALHNFPNMPYVVEEMFWDYYGCEKVIWLETLDGEGTGHADMFSKQLNPTTFIVGEYYAAHNDPDNMAVLNYNAALLASETTAQGQPISVVRIPMPLKGSGWNTTWRTYTNSIIVNNVVVVPTYAQETSYESQALSTYSTVLPGHTIVGVDSDSIIPAGGAVHCVTRTRPAGTVAQIETPPGYLCNGDYDCAPTSGCGDLSYTGMCIANTSVYCNSNSVGDEQCLGNEVCGWNTSQDYIDCVGTGCGSITAQGDCFVDPNSGDTYARYCENNYPMADLCLPTETCGMNASLGHMACQGSTTCTDDCAAGDTGCSGDGTQSWTCGEAGDGDACLDQIWATCPTGTACTNGVCAPVCTDECASGDTGCSPDATQSWTCGEAGDGDACLEMVYTDCPVDETCTAGICEPATTCTDDCTAGDTGCSTDTTQSWTCGEAGDGDDCLDMVYSDCAVDETCTAGICEPATTCTDDCAAGDTGCSPDQLRSWTCGEIGDGDTCLEQIYSNCEAGALCENGTCPTTCTDECAPGGTGCSGATTTWVCGEADDDTCTELVVSACPMGEVCDEGACVPGDEPTLKSGGCNCNTSGTHGAGSTLLLSLLVGFLLWRRRQ